MKMVVQTVYNNSIIPQHTSNPIIKSFLEQESNRILYLNLLLNPSRANKEALDNAFKLFYYEIRLTKYASTLIHNYTIDCIKRYRRHVERHLYILDKKMSDDDSTLMDLLVAEESSIPEKALENYYDTFDQCIENEKLLKAINELTSKQRQILKLYYINGMSIKNIAVFFGETSQNISKTHKRILKKLYKKMEGE